MSCRDYSDAIPALLDGELDLAAQRQVERHVEACPSCRALVADLRTIQAAAFTLDRVELPAHLLPRLHARLDEEPRQPERTARVTFPQTRGAMTAWLAAAAALLLVTGAGLWSILDPFQPPAPTTAEAPAPAGDPVASVQAELQAATEHYERAIHQLEEIARSGDGTLDPQLAAVIEKNLQVIDQAIGENRAALQTQPASPTVQEGLFDALRSKVALLQQTVELINEMRKGNQAEAGRLIQGLNQ